MNDFPSVPNAISHKQLFSLLNTVAKSTGSKKSSCNHSSTKQEEFNELLNHWTQTSQKLIHALKEKSNEVCEELSPNQTMALGALQVHLNMAIQAKQPSEKD